MADITWHSRVVEGFLESPEDLENLGGLLSERAPRVGNRLVCAIFAEGPTNELEILMRRVTELKDRFLGLTFRGFELHDHTVGHVETSSGIRVTASIICVRVALGLLFFLAATDFLSRSPLFDGARQLVDKKTRS